MFYTLLDRDKSFLLFILLKSVVQIRSYTQLLMTKSKNYPQSPRREEIKKRGDSERFYRTYSNESIDILNVIFFFYPYLVQP